MPGHGHHVQFTDSNLEIIISDEAMETKSVDDENGKQCQGALQVSNPLSLTELPDIPNHARGHRDTPPPPPIRRSEINAHIRCGAKSLVRYPLAKKPMDTGLFDSRDLNLSAVMPGKRSMVLYYPPMETWEVIPSNKKSVTVGEVLVKLYKNRSSFPPGSVFNGLQQIEDDVFQVKV